MPTFQCVTNTVLLFPSRSNLDIAPLCVPPHNNSHPPLFAPSTGLVYILPRHISVLLVALLCSFYFMDQQEGESGNAPILFYFKYGYFERFFYFAKSQSFLITLKINNIGDRGFKMHDDNM